MGWHGLAALWCTGPPDAAWAAVQYHSLVAAPGTNYIETLRVQIHANCRIRRIYFSDRLYRCAAFNHACGPAPALVASGIAALHMRLPARPVKAHLMPEWDRNLSASNVADSLQVTLT